MKYTNRKRQPVSAFSVNNIIMLNSRNIKTTRLNKSLDYKNLEPFRVIRVINNMTYELELSNEINVYSIFYF